MLSVICFRNMLRYIMLVKNKLQQASYIENIMPMHPTPGIADCANADQINAGHTIVEPTIAGCLTNTLI